MRTFPLATLRRLLARRRPGLFFWRSVWLLGALPLEAAAQASPQLSGLVRTAPGEPVPFATVSLLHLPDSASVQGGLSDEAGRFAFAQVPAGRYVVHVSALNFASLTSAPFAVAAGGGPVALPPLVLQPAAYALGAVTVRGLRAPVEQQADRVVLRVADSPLAASRSALDVLRLAPGVVVNSDNSISINGKEGATVLLNGRPTYLSAAQLAALLQATDGSRVEAVEVLTSPSARYDAAGSGGLLNIRLREAAGPDGTLTLGLTQGYYARGNTSLALGRQLGRLRLSAALGYLDGRRFVQMGADRVVPDAGGTTYFTQQGTTTLRNQAANYLLAADYEFSKRHTLGGQVSGYANTDRTDRQALTRQGPQPALDAGSLYQQTFVQEVQPYRSVAAHLHDRLQLDTLGQKLSAEVDYARFTAAGRARYASFAYAPGGGRPLDSTYVRQQTPATTDVQAARLDYARPLPGRRGQLEVGARLSRVGTTNALQTQTSSDDQRYAPAPDQSSTFAYAERIAAAYLNLTGKAAALNWQVGLRAEHTAATATLGGPTPTAQSRRYLNWFPSLLASYALTSTQQLSLSANRRIDRPAYDELNPFITYVDRYTRVQGNPLLRPQYLTALELSYVPGPAWRLSLGYNRTTDVQTQLILTDSLTRLTTITFRNLPRLNQYVLGLSAPLAPAPWWSGTLSLSLAYRRYAADPAAGLSTNLSRLVYLLQTSQRWRLGPRYTAELTARYQSARPVGAMLVGATGSVDLGLSRAWLADRLQTSLTVTDLFRQTRTTVRTDYGRTQFVGFEQLDTRAVRFTLAYRFGAGKPAPADAAGGLAPERDRVRGAN